MNPINRINFNTNQGVSSVKRIGDTVHINLILPRNKNIAATSTSSSITRTYAIVTVAPEYNNPELAQYTVQIATLDSNIESETYGQYVGDGTDIIIDRALGFEGLYNPYTQTGDENALDIRNWGINYKSGALVEIISRPDLENPSNDTKYYINCFAQYFGSETVASVRNDYENGITLAVWA